MLSVKRKRKRILQFRFQRFLSQKLVMLAKQKLIWRENKSKIKEKKENSLAKRSSRPNLLSDDLLKKTKDIIIGTRNAGTVISRKMVIAIGTGQLVIFVLFFVCFCFFLISFLVSFYAVYCTRYLQNFIVYSNYTLYT